MMCYFARVEDNTFQHIVVKGPRWLDMEGTCAKLHIVSFS
jgi:hypothetical protein